MPRLALLAVGQGVHRVDDDGPDAPPAALAQDVVHDRHDVGHALARAGAGGQHVGQARAGDADGLGLVAVREQRLPVALRLGLDAEDAAALGVQDAPRDQVVDGRARLEGGVELDEGLGPEDAGLELAVDVVAQAGVADLDEAAGVGGVVLNQVVAEVEDVHGAASRSGHRRRLQRTG